MEAANLEVVHAYGTQAEADIAKSVLAGAGLEAMIQADSVGGMRAHVAWSGAGFKLLVREEDVMDARELLEPAEE